MWIYLTQREKEIRTFFITLIFLGCNWNLGLVLLECSLEQIFGISTNFWKKERNSTVSPDVIFWYNTKAIFGSVGGFYIELKLKSNKFIERWWHCSWLTFLWQTIICLFWCVSYCLTFALFLKLDLWLFLPLVLELYALCGFVM